MRRKRIGKLIKAFRAREQRHGTAATDEWVAEVAAEYPDEDWIETALDEPDDEVEPEPWHDLYYRAWDSLRHDRSYGAFGGESPISYSALSQYARDHDIAGSDHDIFVTFMSAIDAEYLSIAAERQRQRSQGR
ncbi:phage tail assembly chaperone [Rhizobium sp. A37_96]